MSAKQTKSDSDKSEEVSSDEQSLVNRIGKSGLVFSIAEDIESVQNAWKMVYSAYRRRDLILSNSFRLHTASQAIGDHSVVVIGCIAGLTVTTLTIIGDSDKGLPLDRVYPDELASLRDSGRRLMEVGLFADRREKLARSAEGLLQLMRYTYYFGIHQKIDDIMIGVHPRHAKFYIRSFGFEYAGDPRHYSALNDRPVVLLRGDIEANSQRVPPHPSLEFYKQNPIDRREFEERFSFRSEQLSGTALEAYLLEQDGL